jgi:ABC-2 type transport system permease protein
VTGFGVMVLMIMAALAITSEYRFGTIRTTFQAVPNRASVLIAKAGLIGAFGAALTSYLIVRRYSLSPKPHAGDA